MIARFIIAVLLIGVMMFVFFGRCALGAEVSPPTDRSLSVRYPPVQAPFNEVDRVIIPPYPYPASETAELVVIDVSAIPPPVCLIERRNRLYEFDYLFTTVDENLSLGTLISRPNDDSVINIDLMILENGNLVVVYNDWTGSYYRMVARYCDFLARLYTTDPPCFMAGTRIRTPDGETAIEKLRPGDRVISALKVPVRVVELIRFEAPVTQQNTPILIKKHSIGHLMPHTDLRVSPDHGVRVGQKMESAESLIGHHSDVEYLDRYSLKIVYYHLQVERDGLEAASYRPYVHWRHWSHRGKK